MRDVWENKKETYDKRGNHTTQVFELKNDGSLPLYTILNTTSTLLYFSSVLIATFFEM